MPSRERETSGHSYAPSAQAQEAAQDLGELPRAEPVPLRHDAEQGGCLGAEFGRIGVARAGGDQPLRHLPAVEQRVTGVLRGRRREISVTSAPGGDHRAFDLRESGDLGHREERGCCERAGGSRLCMRQVSHSGRPPSPAVPQ